MKKPNMKSYPLTILMSLAVSTAIAANPSGSLPIMYINTENSANITSKDSYINATYYLDPSGSDFNAIGSADDQLPLQIRGRGNYTWSSFNKKPYRIKLDKKTSLLGMQKSKHFALLAHADDNRGFMRNAVGLELSRLINMSWTPDDQPVEVVLNGKYIGLYFLTETIRVDSNRVSITEQVDNATDNDDITGGWLIEIDNYDSDPHVSVSESGDNNYKINFTYHSPEVLSDAQTSYLTNQMSSLNSAIYSSNKSDCKWAEYVDLEELARYYIVQELVDDYESFHGSCFLYKDRGSNEKWYFGPVWDFGSAFNYDKSQYIYQGREHHQVWIGEMCKYPQFIEKVKTVWRDFLSNHYADIFDYINDYRDYIYSAALSDAQQWPQYGNSDLKSRVSQVKKRLSGSFEWLCKQWGGTIPQYEDTSDVVTAYFIDNVTPPWTDVHAYAWDYSGNLLHSWPGTSMTATTVNGQNAWMIKFNPDHDLPDNTGIIFNNSHSGSGNQTADLILVNGGIYNRDGLISGIQDVSTENLSIIASNGALTIDSQIARCIIVTRIDGTQLSLQVLPGLNTFSLPHGFYIINAKKYIL
jgi:hypothetical protein